MMLQGTCPLDWLLNNQVVVAAVKQPFSVHLQGLKLNIGQSVQFAVPNVYTMWNSFPLILIRFSL